MDRDEFAKRIPDSEDRRRFVEAIEAHLSHVSVQETIVQKSGWVESDAPGQPDAQRFFGRASNPTASQPESFSIGSILADRFRIKGQVALGGTAAVYLVRDEAFDVDRILKSINHQRISAQSGIDWEELALAEARALARLESRNIVTVHDIVRAGEDSYIVMDLLRGRDLYGVIRAVTAKRDELGLGRGGKLQAKWIEEAIGEDVRGEFEYILDPKDWYRSCARIARYMLRALGLAHAEGICHRDIKPANIFIVGGGEPVILDFGFGSCPGGMDCMEDSLVGTPPYMAPEQFSSGRSGTDPRTDLYQLGVALYEFVTLVRPFDPTSQDFYGAKLEGTFPSPQSVDPNMPSALAAIINRALSATLDGRYQSAREMCVDLERFEQGKPPLLAPVDTATKVGMWSLWTARRPAFLVGLAAAILLVATWVLRTERWVPPVLSSMHSIGGAAPSASSGDQVLRWEDTPIDIGLVIEASSPSMLYAFELYGQEDAQLYIRPLPFDSERAYMRAEERGSTPVLTLDGSEQWSIEQVYVLATEESNAVLDEFIVQLGRDIASGLDVPFDEDQLAKLLVGRTRGTSRADMAPERREALEQAFDPGLQPTDAMYSKAGVKPFRFEYYIQYDKVSD